MNRWYFNSKENIKSYNQLIEMSELLEKEKLLIRVNWLNYLKQLDKIAIKDSLFFNVLQLLVIIIGIFIPIIEQTELNSKIGDSSITVITILGVTIAIATAVIRHFKFEERWKHYRKNAEFIRNEGEDFFALAGNYGEFKTLSTAFKKFIENITNIKRQEVDTFIIKVRKKE